MAKNKKKFDDATPKQIQTVVREGFERLHHYRNATAMFIREYVGDYYRKTSGIECDNPLNLMFNAVRTIIPTMATDNPINLVTTPYTFAKDYAELLSLGLDSIEEKMRMKNIIRGWIAQALFGMGIMKVGIQASDSLIEFGDIRIDPGQLYAKLVNIDNFVIDPLCGDWNEAEFMGHRSMVPRQLLLDMDGFNHDLVMQLPASGILGTDGKRLGDLTQLHAGKQAMVSLQDMVDVVELWVPKANALVTIPDPYQITFDKFLRATDYYGPKEGPYVDLSFSPPVSGNPLPIAPASVWFDLHRLANTVFKKVIQQALDQKDVVFYSPAQADEAEDLREAENGSYIRSTDPKGIQQVSLGGQNRSNEVFLSELQMLFNYMAGNPDQMSGNMTAATSGGASQTATKAAILQSNASVSIEDARQILYDRTAEVSRRLAWYMNVDPFINLPLIKRENGEDVQVELTPEQRSGDFLDFTFNIKARSMTRLNPDVRAKRIVEFCVNIVPSLVMSASQAMQMGVPFNLQKTMILIGNEMGIGDWVTEIFNDPDYENKLMLMMMLGPQNSGKGGSPLTPAGVAQNGGNPLQQSVATPEQEFNQQAQEGANMAQGGMVGAI